MSGHLGMLLHILRNQFVALPSVGFPSRTGSVARVLSNSPALHLALRGELIAQVFQCRAGQFGEHSRFARHGFFELVSNASFRALDP